MPILGNYDYDDYWVKILVAANCFRAQNDLCRYGDVLPVTKLEMAVTIVGMLLAVSGYAPVFCM